MEVVGRTSCRGENPRNWVEKSEPFAPPGEIPAISWSVPTFCGLQAVAQGCIGLLVVLAKPANPADLKQAIYRAPQGTPGDWNSWGAPTLVVSAGTTLGVGEPTVTSHGDLSFVVIYQDGSGTTVDTYDADPWYLPHQQR